MEYQTGLVATGPGVKEVNGSLGQSLCTIFCLKVAKLNYKTSMTTEIKKHKTWHKMTMKCPKKDQKRAQTDPRKNRRWMMTEKENYQNDFK